MQIWDGCKRLCRLLHPLTTHSVSNGQEYVEKIWDHATGDLLVRKAGGVVSDMLGRPLDYSYGRLLQGNCGVLASANRQVHDQIVDIYAKLSTDSEI